MTIETCPQCGQSLKRTVVRRSTDRSFGDPPDEVRFDCEWCGTEGSYTPFGQRNR
jgi:predicted RNA-binding Zn-ribbon protein involved in translation (DUF1610 family)